MQTGIDSDDTDSSPVIGVGKLVQSFQDGLGSDRDHTTLDSCMGDIYEEGVHWRLRWTDLEEQKRERRQLKG